MFFELYSLDLDIESWVSSDLTHARYVACCSSHSRLLLQIGCSHWLHRMSKISIDAWECLWISVDIHETKGRRPNNEPQGIPETLDNTARYKFNFLSFEYVTSRCYEIFDKYLISKCWVNVQYILTDSPMCFCFASSSSSFCCAMWLELESDGAIVANTGELRLWQISAGDSGPQAVDRQPCPKAIGFTPIPATMIPTLRRITQLFVLFGSFWKSSRF